MTSGPVVVRLRPADAAERSLFRRMSAESGTTMGSGRATAPDDGDEPGREVVGATHVALVDGRVAGFCSVVASGKTGQGVGVLESVFVLEQWRRRGVGRALVAHAGVVAAGLGAVSLTVDAHPSLETFFRRVGGRPVTPRPPDETCGWYTPVLHLDVPIGATA